MELVIYLVMLILLPLKRLKVVQLHVEVCVLVYVREIVPLHVLDVLGVRIVVPVLAT